MEIFRKFIIAIIVAFLCSAVFFVLLYVCDKEDPIWMTLGFGVGMFFQIFFKTTITIR